MKNSEVKCLVTFCVAAAPFYTTSSSNEVPLKLVTPAWRWMTKSWTVPWKAWFIFDCFNLDSLGLQRLFANFCWNLNIYIVAKNCSVLHEITGDVCIWTAQFSVSRWSILQHNSFPGSSPATPVACHYSYTCSHLLCQTHSSNGVQ